MRYTRTAAVFNTTDYYSFEITIDYYWTTDWTAEWTADWTADWTANMHGVCVPRVACARALRFAQCALTHPLRSTSACSQRRSYMLPCSAGGVCSCASLRSTRTHTPTSLHICMHDASLLIVAVFRVWRVLVRFASLNAHSHTHIAPHLHTHSQSALSSLASLVRAAFCGVRGLLFEVTPLIAETRSSACFRFAVRSFLTRFARSGGL